MPDKTNVLSNKISEVILKAVADFTETCDPARTIEGMYKSIETIANQVLEKYPNDYNQIVIY
jgi:hypothetical protein